jgi:uncharacterized protein YdaU (DUF1376 family)
MNYYPRYPGDYMRDTGHLSLVEHGAYTVLLDHYYAKAGPLPASLEALVRLCRAMTDQEQAAVKTVTEEFFPLSNDGLRHNARADAEIADWDAYSAKQRELSRRGVKAKREKRAQGSSARSTEGSTDGLIQRLTPPPPPPPPESGVLEDSDSRPRRRTQASTQFHLDVIDAYHELLPDLPRVKIWSEKRARALEARIQERVAAGKPADKIEYWRELFRGVSTSDLLCGRSGAWCADLEWLTKAENFVKVIEGRYSQRPGANGGREQHAR